MTVPILDTHLDFFWLQLAAEMVSILGPDFSQLSKVRVAIMEAEESVLEMLKKGICLCH